MIPLIKLRSSINSKDFKFDPRGQNTRLKLIDRRAMPRKASEPALWHDERLAEGTLAGLWEADASLRQNMHDPDFPHLTRWIRSKKGKGPRAIGVPSVPAMALNVRALEIMASWYCPVATIPKAIPIDILRREACAKYVFITFFRFLLGPFIRD